VENPLGTEQFNSKGKIYDMYMLHAGTVAMRYLWFLMVPSRE